MAQCGADKKKQVQHLLLLTAIAYLIAEMAVEAMTMMVKLAAMKLIHPGVPPTTTRQIAAKASSATIATTNHVRRSIFLLSLRGGYTFPPGSSLNGCSWIDSLASLCCSMFSSSSLELIDVCGKNLFSHK